MACNNYTSATQTTYFLPKPQRRLFQSTAREMGYLGLPPAALLQTCLCHLCLHTHKMAGSHDVTTPQQGWRKSHQGTTTEKKGHGNGWDKRGSGGLDMAQRMERGKDGVMGRGLRRWDKPGLEGGRNRELRREGQREGGGGQAVSRGGLGRPGRRGPHPPPPHRPGRAARPAAAAAPPPPHSHSPPPRCHGRKSAAQPVPPRRRRGSAAPRKAPDRSVPGQRALGPAATAPAHRPGSWRQPPRSPTDARRWPRQRPRAERGPRPARLRRPPPAQRPPRAAAFPPPLTGLALPQPRRP